MAGRNGRPAHAPGYGDSEADASDSDEDEETRRVAYLRRHRALLEQKRRLETERRVSELEGDKASINKRQEALKDAKLRMSQAQEAAARKPLARRPSHSLPALGTSVSTTPKETGVYTQFDALSTDALQEIADKQALRDMEPLNTRGKYHARFMKDAYPIAGTQLKLEREREMILAAKKKLLLSKAQALETDHSVRAHSRGGSGGGGFGQFAYRKLDFYVDRFSAVLQREQTHVEAAKDERQVRLVEIQHRQGLEEFWRLMHRQRFHETEAWLKTHRFKDVNVPVVVRQSASVPLPKGEEPAIVVEPNRDVGLTPLMAACRLHSVAIVRALLEQDTAVYLRTANGDTAAHFLFHDWHDTELTTMRLTTDALVRADHTHRILQMLLSAKADVNVQNAFGESVLQHCARLGLLDCVKLLISHDADAHARDRTGASALDYARTHHHDDIQRILQNYEIIERTKAKEHERLQSLALLKRGRGALTANWSESPDKLLARLAVEDRRAGHLRNQFVDRHGGVIVCDDSDEADDDDEHGGT